MKAKLPSLTQLEVGAIIVGAAIVGLVLYRVSKAAASVVTDAASAAGSAVDLTVSGVAGGLGQVYGLPTPATIAADRTPCTSATSWFDASKNCSAADFMRWLRGDFAVSPAYPDESVRGSRASMGQGA